MVKKSKGEKGIDNFDNMLFKILDYFEGSQNLECFFFFGAEQTFIKVLKE